jgi:hypothetical protein
MYSSSQQTGFWHEQNLTSGTQWHQIIKTISNHNIEVQGTILYSTEKSQAPTTVYSISLGIPSLGWTASEIASISWTACSSSSPPPDNLSSFPSSPYTLSFWHMSAFIQTIICKDRCCTGLYYNSTSSNARTTNTWELGQPLQGVQVAHVSGVNTTLSCVLTLDFSSQHQLWLLHRCNLALEHKMLISNGCV